MDVRKVLALFGSTDRTFRGRIHGAFWKSLWERISRSYLAVGDEAGRNWYWKVFSGAESPVEPGQPGDIRVRLLENQNGTLRAVFSQPNEAFTYAGACWMQAGRGVPNKAVGRVESNAEATARAWFAALQVERRLIGEILSDSERFVNHTRTRNVAGAAPVVEEQRVNLKRNHLCLFIGNGRVANTEQEYAEAKRTEGSSAAGGAAPAPPQPAQDPLKVIAERSEEDRARWAQRVVPSAVSAGGETIHRNYPELVHLAGQIRVGDSNVETHATYQYAEGFPRRAPEKNGYPTLELLSSPANILTVYQALAAQAMGVDWAEQTDHALERHGVFLDEEKSTDSSIHVTISPYPREIGQVPGTVEDRFLRVLFALLSTVGGKRRLGLVDLGGGNAVGAHAAPLGLFGARRDPAPPTTPATENNNGEANSQLDATATSSTTPPLLGEVVEGNLEAPLDPTQTSATSSSAVFPEPPAVNPEVETAGGEEEQQAEIYY